MSGILRFAQGLREYVVSRKCCIVRHLARRLQWFRTMPTMLVTCPESAHLEEIELESTPLGLLVVSCSAFPGGECPMTCPRTCAARLDRKIEVRHADKVGKVLLARSCIR